jgi:hypothetical protein
MICAIRCRSALFGEEVILLPLPVFEPPTPIKYPSHTTHTKHQVPKHFTHSLYVTNCNTKVTLLPLPVFQPPTPIMYPSHTTHIKHQVPNPSPIPFMIPTATQNALHNITVPVYISQTAFDHIGTYCCWFVILHWVIEVVFSDAASL